MVTVEVAKTVGKGGWVGGSARFFFTWSTQEDPLSVDSVTGTRATYVGAEHLALLMDLADAIITKPGIVLTRGRGGVSWRGGELPLIDQGRFQKMLFYGVLVYINLVSACISTIPTPPPKKKKKKTGAFLKTQATCFLGFSLFP